MKPLDAKDCWAPRPLETLRRPLGFLPAADRWLLRALLWLLGPLVRVEAPTALATPGPVIFAFTHSTFFETLFAALVLCFHRQERVAFLVDWMYGRLPGFRWLVAKVDPIYVWNKRSQFGWINRHKGARPPRTAWEEAAERLALGRALAIFPEGKAHRDPQQLRKGRRGLGHMALTAAAVVVPVGIDFPLRRTKGRIPRVGRLLFRVGLPMAFPAESSAYRSSQDPRHQAQLADSATHGVMLELARLSGRAYPYPAIHPC
ncbi:1-acyl-sn-glycerol-3-phosphate acyltransferase [Geothrix sp. PMB-07]|uniref:lysophospholipid acyltransferase family protein n=1 Tax=Geothrix sp. PMB-07 TaxID=3068640 RepID=UPI00274155B4|nr:lysophospholipid acyltransferase family protein [Geothrix sp. PMB-07]WLT31108.1 lysophospholipid acyltransferase family protein [Geothrix sp. PMB-07]